MKTIISTTCWENVKKNRILNSKILSEGLTWKWKRVLERMEEKLKEKNVSLEYSNTRCLQHDRKLKLKFLTKNIDQCFPSRWYSLHNVLGVTAPWQKPDQIYSYTRRTIYLTKCLTALYCWAKIQNYAVFFIIEFSRHILAKLEL